MIGALFIFSLIVNASPTYKKSQPAHIDPSLLNFAEIKCANLVDNQKYRALIFTQKGNRIYSSQVIIKGESGNDNTVPLKEVFFIALGDMKVTLTGPDVTVSFNTPTDSKPANEAQINLLRMNYESTDWICKVK